jgi:hypothetical protein
MLSLNTFWTRSAKVPGPLAICVAAPVLAASALAVSAYEPAASAQAAPTGTFTSRVFASGARIFHATAKGEEPISDPDDITFLEAIFLVSFVTARGRTGLGDQDRGLVLRWAMKNATIRERASRAASSL